MMTGRDRAVSGPIGVALLNVIVAMLAVVVLAMASGFTLPQPRPQVAAGTAFEVSHDPAANRTDRFLLLEHRAGEDFDARELSLTVSLPDGRTVRPPREGGERFGPGSSLRYNLTDADLCAAAGEEVTVTVVHEPSESVVATEDVPVKEAAYEIRNNSVGADAAYRATVTIPGSGYATLERHDGTDYYLYWPIESRIVVSGNGSVRTRTPFPDGDPDDALAHDAGDDINNPVYDYPMTYTTDTIRANESVAVEMVSYVFDGDDSTIVGEGSTRTYGGTAYEEAHIPLTDDNRKRVVESSDADEENVELLRDGDTVPSWGESSPHQDSLEELLSGKIGADGELDLADNEFVAVFELNEDAHGGDFNDAVAVIELHPRPTYANTTSDRILACGG